MQTCTPTLQHLPQKPVFEHWVLPLVSICAHTYVLYNSTVKSAVLTCHLIVAKTLTYNLHYLSATLSASSDTALESMFRQAFRALTSCWMTRTIDES